MLTMTFRPRDDAVTPSSLPATHLDPLALMHWERLGRQAFDDGLPRSANPNERRARSASGPLDTDEVWIAKRDAWLRGWDSGALASAD